MAGMALAAIVLISVVIYSLSQLNSIASSSPLHDLTIQPTLRQNLPHFEYSDEGKTLKPENFAGHWTLMTFWAYYCAPCLEEMPALNQLQQQNADFEITTVNVDEPGSESFEAARHYLSDQQIVLATLFDRKGVLKKAFDVTELPQHFLISPEGKIVWKATGAFKWNEAKARDQLARAMNDDVEDSTEPPGPDSTEAPAK